MDGTSQQERRDDEEAIRNADALECIKKLKMYEAAYAWRLKAKYFTKKAFDGGDIFDHETTIDNEIVKSSRWPCTRSFADPIQTVEDPNSPPSSVAETSSTPTKKTPTKKIC
ncbi:uncharacterized protein LOC109849397 [Asparagus officinalis]|uniref:uncharacterized protein LOC109849397 n=1 Tax=Asparagus officinalis TaxID=4686 RepID=UPI00098E65F4|nr:uncharacterized protein LOC109849397 [Asparagus officinalis]